MRHDVKRRQIEENRSHSLPVGIYSCAVCGCQLLVRENRIDRASGWPIFLRPVGNNITTRLDPHLEDFRTEIVCARCQSHLGHVVRENSRPKALRYCINAMALVFQKNL